MMMNTSPQKRGKREPKKLKTTAKGHLYIKKPVQTLPPQLPRDKYLDRLEDDNGNNVDSKKQPTVPWDFLKSKKKIHHAPFDVAFNRTLLDSVPFHVPSYLTATARPSKFPKRHFCCCCGQLSKYKCKHCNVYYCSLSCDEYHKEMRCLKFVE